MRALWLLISTLISKVRHHVWTQNASVMSPHNVIVWWCVGRMEPMLAETMFADLCARAARVCWRKCTGCTTKNILRCFLVTLSLWCILCTCANIPVQPVRVDLRTWFLPTWFPWPWGDTTTCAGNHSCACASLLRTNGVNTNGAAAKVALFLSDWGERYSLALLGR